MNLNYGCRNGAWHDYICCETCWNKHPDAEKGIMFLGSPRYYEILRSEYINGAMIVGFTEEQAEFLYKNYVINYG